MTYENNEKRNDSVYSKRIRAGKRRTYFFDVRTTRGNDYYLTITESRKRFNDDGYDRHKIFLYKEDFNKFIKALGEAIDHVKTELMPDFDFDAFNHEYDEDGEHAGGGEGGYSNNYAQASSAPAAAVEASTESIDEEPSTTSITSTTSDSSTSSTSSSNPSDSSTFSEGDNGADEQVDKW